MRLTEATPSVLHTGCFMGAKMVKNGMYAPFLPSIALTEGFGSVISALVNRVCRYTAFPGDRQDGSRRTLSFKNASVMVSDQDSV